MRYPAVTQVVLFASLFAVSSSAHAESQRVVVSPQDNEKVLTNPGMGWMFHHYDNSLKIYTSSLQPPDKVEEFPGVSVVYLRLAWSYLEPQEGQFRWSILDTPIQKWTQAGKQVAFRFTTAEGPNEAGGYATPKWVKDAGAKGYYVLNGKIVKDGPEWEPDFNDPIYLAKLDHFLAAAAEHYDGKPQVAFVDVGFGLWGEGHTYSSTFIPYDASTICRHIDLYKKNFKKTLLIANDDFAIQGRGLEVLGYARDQGLGLRDDSILVQGGERAYYHAYLSYNFWPRVPVILESEHYGDSKRIGAWQDGHLYLQAVEDYHASYATVHWFPRAFLAENRQLIHDISMRLGYRLQLQEVSWPATIVTGSSFQVGYRWANVGVAPCLPGGHPTITLEDEAGGIAGVFVDEDFNVRELPVGPKGSVQPIARHTLPSRLPIPQQDKPLISYDVPTADVLRPGTYSVFVSVGDVNGTPIIALPLNDDDGHRRYKVGNIVVSVR
jgi:hypothetical protein